MKPQSTISAAIQITFADWLIIIAFIFGGCCSNVFALELLIGDAPMSGNLITFAQFLFVSIEGLHYHLEFLPRFRLKRRIIPISRWIVLVVMFFTVSILNNIALGYNIPVPLHIIFRSGGLIVGMILGWLVIGKRYNFKQVLAVILVTIGVISATLDSTDKKSKETDDVSTRDDIFGVTLLSIALVLSCLMGIYQEITYKKYGSNWREGLFYTHCLGLPLFLVFYSDLCNQVQILNTSPVISPAKVLPDAIRKTILGDLVSSLLNVFRIRTAWLYLFFNVLTQYVCISGVHRLNSRVTALTLNLVLNVRKFTSLCISVLYFDNDLTLGMAVGGLLVFVGTCLYSLGSTKKADSEPIDKEHEKTTKLE